MYAYTRHRNYRRCFRIHPHQHHTTPHHAPIPLQRSAQYHIPPHSTALRQKAPQYTAPYCTVHQGTSQRSTAPHSTAWYYCTTLRTALHCTALRDAAPHHKSLPCTAKHHVPHRSVPRHTTQRRTTLHHSTLRTVRPLCEERSKRCLVLPSVPFNLRLNRLALACLGVGERVCVRIGAGMC